MVRKKRVNRVKIEEMKYDFLCYGVMGSKHEGNKIDFCVMGSREIRDL